MFESAQKRLVQQKQQTIKVLVIMVMIVRFQVQELQLSLQQEVVVEQMEEELVKMVALVEEVILV